MFKQRVKRELLEKMADAQQAIADYLTLRKVKGYMLVKESEQLRDDVFELCGEYRSKSELLTQIFLPQEVKVIDKALAALCTAAVCLGSGPRQCPSYIAVDAEKLENCLTQLSACLHQLTDSQHPTAA